MVTSDGYAKILDFGLAKLRALPEGDSEAVTTTREGTVMGTVGYMSPEQVRGLPADHRADVFAFGCVLYEMLCRRRAFSGATPADTMSAILLQDPHPIEGPAGDIPGTLQGLVHRCLEKRMEDRFQSATELCHALEVEIQALQTLGGRVGKTPTPGPIRSIAVLPLVSYSDAPEQMFFAGSMTDALITDLAKIGALRVVSRTSVMRYRETEKSIPEIARELNVDAVVEGSVERSGTRVRIKAALIRAETDQHLWADAYERDLEDVLVLQDEVARSIAREIQVKLTPHEHAVLSRAPRVDREAYDLYLKGRYFWVKRTPESVQKAIGYFSQAIGADPTYAQAYGGLADCYMSLGFSFDVGSLPPNEAIPKAKAAAAKALAIDDMLAEVHNPVAFMKLNYDWDFLGSEAEFKRALELNPGHANAHHWYAHLLIATGRSEESLAESNRALELDPLSPILTVHLGWLYYYLRQYELAMDILNKTLELEPTYGLAYWYIGLVKEQEGKFTEALDAMRHGAELLKDNLVVKADLAHALAVSGHKADAGEALQELHSLSQSRYVNPFEIGLIHIGLGQSDEALDWLNRAYEERSDLMIYLRVDPRLDPLRSDPGFQDLVHRMNFPD
jgi:TolB-like protein/Tfp pilus assembly protein PilF